MQGELLASLVEVIKMYYQLSEIDNKQTLADSIVADCMNELHDLIGDDSVNELPLLIYNICANNSDDVLKPAKAILELCGDELLYHTSILNK